MLQTVLVLNLWLAFSSVREIRHLDREEVKVKKEMKRLARDGQEEALRITARNLVKLKKTRAQIWSTKDSVSRSFLISVETPLDPM